MFDCSTECPKCQHRFQCCRSSTASCTAPIGPPACCVVSAQQRTLQLSAGGGLISPLTMTPLFPVIPNIPVAAVAVPQHHQQIILPQHHQLQPQPQQSPSIHLAFILPDLFGMVAPAVSQDTIISRLAETVRALRLSGWYYGQMTYEASAELLKDTAVGTFLVRDSTDPRFKFSLSIQTERGPTSARLVYLNGKFRINAQPNMLAEMPQFTGVVDLVEYYVRQSAGGKCTYQWVDADGSWYADITLRRPLRKDNSPAGLKHLARSAVHKALQATGRPRINLLPAAHTQLPELPSSVRDYLGEYPYSI